MCEPDDAFMQALVKCAQDFALRNPAAYHEAWHELTPDAENRIIFALMDGDDCALGALVRHVLQTAVIENAKDRVIDAQAEAEDAA